MASWICLSLSFDLSLMKRKEAVVLGRGPRRSSCDQRISVPKTWPRERNIPPLNALRETLDARGRPLSRRGGNSCAVGSLVYIVVEPDPHTQRLTQRGCALAGGRIPAVRTLVPSGSSSVIASGGKKDPGLRSQPDSGLMNHGVDPTPQYVMMNVSGRRPSAVDCVAQPGTFSSDVKCRRSIQDSNLSRSAE